MTENPQGLRKATPEDADALFDFVLPLVTESSLQAVSEVKLRLLVDRCCAQDRGVAAVIEGADGGLEGSVGATIDTDDISDDAHIMVRWLGTTPAFYRTDYNSRMLRYVEWMHGLVVQMSDVPIPVILPALTTFEHRLKIQLYQRRAPQVGALYAWGLDDRNFFTPEPLGKKRKVAHGAKAA